MNILVIENVIRITYHSCWSVVVVLVGGLFVFCFLLLFFLLFIFLLLFRGVKVWYLCMCHFGRGINYSASCIIMFNHICLLLLSYLVRETNICK
jgi:hypothetical protein